MAWRVLATMVLASAVLCISLPAAALPPIEAFANLPEYSRPALSPDGKHFAVVRSFKGRRAVSIQAVDAPDGTPPALVDARGGHIVTIRWANNNRLIVIVKINKRAVGRGRIYTWWRAFSVGADGKNLAVMLDDAPLDSNVNAATIADIDLDDPDHVFMPLIGGGVFNSLPALHVYRVDVNSGKSEIAVPGTMWTQGWIMDGHGHVSARIDVYSRELRYHIMVPGEPGKDYRDIGAFDLYEGGAAFIGGVAQDGRGLVMQMPSPARTSGLYRIDLSTLAQTLLYTNEKYDVDGTIADEWTGAVIGAAYIADKVEYSYFDPKLQRMQSALERAFAGQEVAMLSCDVARRACVVETNAPQHPPVLYLLDTATMHASPIGPAYPQLTEADLGEMRAYPYAARDGMLIPAYLTLPPGRAAKNLPLVVMPHGGPDARDYLGFDWWAQFLANRGYAVLQPNYRGSRGYGVDFARAGFHQSGLKIESDLADGVAKLVADGIADAKRVCIVGASYGGYAALAGVAFTPDHYACAVSVAGISDLVEWLRYVEQSGGAESGVYSRWQAHLGDSHIDADAARIADTSPALHADAIRAPVLLLHGADDTTVPIAQSNAMRDALQAAHKPVHFVELEGDDHSLQLAATRVRVLGEIEKFLAANIGN